MPAPALDRTLLAGFRFACRPRCALCCFTTPAVGPEEVGPLIQIAPGLRLEPGAGGFHFVPSRPRGGACLLLSGARCTAHAARPFPCRTFPLAVYLGRRTQAALVLTCPGVDLAPLAEFPQRDAAEAPPHGLDQELHAVEAELAGSEGLERSRAAQAAYDRAVRRLEARDRWADVDRTPSALVDRALQKVAERLPAERPPEAAEGIETLPLTLRSATGVVALAGTPDGWTLLPLDEASGAGIPEGPYPDLGRPPVLERPAAQLLRGYLHYVLARDSFVGQAILRLLEGAPGRLDAVVVEDLTDVAAQVVSRAAVLEAAHGRIAVRLDAAAVAAGIRATDAEVLDRPHVGEVL